jgi:hypothetical protein
VLQIRGGTDACGTFGNLAHFNYMAHLAPVRWTLRRCTVFALKRDGSEETIVHRFPSGRKDGRNPGGRSWPIEWVLYGTTNSGGNGACTTGYGTIYSVTPR